MGSVADHCGHSRRQRDCSLGLTQRGWARILPQGLAPSAHPRFPIRAPTRGLVISSRAARPSLGTLPTQTEAGAVSQPPLRTLGRAPPNLGTSPTHPLLFGKRRNRLSSDILFSFLSIPALECRRYLQGWAFPESEVGQSPAVLQRPLLGRGLAEVHGFLQEPCPG